MSKRLAGRLVRKCHVRRLTLEVNTILKGIFDNAGLQLVDFKLEFGRFHGELFSVTSLVQMAVVSGTS